jgi:APA family basic amino acid/polyamine antiporter
MVRDIFHTKSLDAILAQGEASEHQLRRALGAFDVVMLGIGAIIGAGIFATIGTAAAGDASRPGAGPALILSFVLTAVACGFAALCYAEFAAMVPISGSAYTYAYATLGELVAWIIGWDLIIEYAVGNVAVAISWGNYFKTFVEGFGIVIPDWLSTDYRTAARIPRLFAHAPHLFGVPIVFNILAFAIVAAITLVLVVGIRESASINSAMVVLKLIVLGIFVAVGWGYTRAEHWHPFAPNGWAGVQAGAAIVFFAYIGFDAVSTVAEEVRNPARDLPIGIIGSLIICTIVYVVVALVFTGIIPYDALVKKLATEQAEPLTMALQYAHIERWGNLLIGVVAFGSIVAHTAVLLVFQLGQPRIFFSMARDGLLPASFARVHPTYRTPHVTTIFTGVAVAVCAMFTSIDEMVDLTNIGTLFAFILVCIGIIVLRRREPTRPRSFKTPLVPFVPMCGVIACVYLMLGLPWITWIRFAVWLLVGLVIYFGYGRQRSANIRAGRS